MKLDEQRPTVIRLANGQTYPIDELLAHTFQVYTETRRLYNLAKKTKANKARQVGANKSRTKSKYSEQDAIWMRDKTAQEIADKYNITKHQAYYIKNYVKRLWG